MRTCPHCNERPVATYQTGKNAGRQKSYCRECQVKIIGAYKRGECITSQYKRRVSPEQRAKHQAEYHAEYMKRKAGDPCAKCKQSPRGASSIYCHACNYEIHRAWYAENRERRKEQSVIYRKNKKRKILNRLLGVES